MIEIFKFVSNKKYYNEKNSWKIYIIAFWLLLRTADFPIIIMHSMDKKC
jgi:hypothetical protein